MNEELRLRVESYVNEMEDTVCDEHHGNSWPECDRPEHAEGRTILAMLRSV